MATYYIVEKDKDPLGPDEIPAGSTIDVQDGDIFILDGADDDIKFESATGNPTSFEIQINDSNPESFDIEIEDDLDATITIADGVNISDVDFKAKDADSVALTAGDNVSIGKYEGSEDGTDNLTFGDNFTTTEDIKTGDGDDVIVIGENATIEKIETGRGNDSITIGDNLVAEDIKTGNGEDSITIGDGATVDDINTGRGGDRVVLGDDFTGDKVETKGGNDYVGIGSGAVIDDLDGGGGTDTLSSDTDIPGAASFEDAMCFVRGTLILSCRGEVPIETLQTGDLIYTLDQGPQPILWIGSSVVSGYGRLAPVRIARGTLGTVRDLWVSQQHRLLVAGWRAELYFGQPEVLVAAKHLVDGKGIEIVETEEVEYFHILFDEHQLVLSEGVPSESFHPGAEGMETLSEACREQIFALFPELRDDISSYGQSARTSLRAFEGQLLVA